MKQILITVALIAAIQTGSGIGHAEESFYKEPLLFNFTHPVETLPKQSIERFGPVGMSITLKLPAFQMVVGKIEQGSPAEACGKLKEGQKIESINGQVLKDIDPRIQLARIITDAEASDGKVVFKIEGVADAVVKIPVLGAYSKSWPLNCPKSDAIVRNLAKYIKENGSYTIDTEGWASFDGFGALFLLSTGDKGDLDVVRGWMKENVERLKDAKEIPLKPWAFGPGALPLAEYYLRTGDKSVLPIIEKIADHVRRMMFDGGWSGRGKIVFRYGGSGHMNAAGVHVATFLLLAKECGVKVDDNTLQTSLRHFARYAGKGSLSYGDNLPETYFINNGKTEALAFTMAAAASLTPDGEKSVYAKARDVSAASGFYDTNYMLVGHTGGGIGEAWRGPAMGLLYKKEPKMYRSFMDGRQWHLEMSRRFNGSFSMLNSGGPYWSPDTWGHMMGMQYTVPRKTLRMTGAVRTKYSKPYKLPVRPWGTAEDDDFCSTKPAAYSDGTVPEFPQTLEEGTINGIERHYRAAGVKDVRYDKSDPSTTSAKPKYKDELVLRYCHHPDHEVRREIGGFYRGPEQDKHIVPMLKHKDARVRRTALTVLHHVHKGEHVLPAERLTDEMMELVFGMINDPDESWWVVENALRAASLAPVEKLAPHMDRLLFWLAHDDWWLQQAAVYAVAPLAADERYYKKVMPKIKEMIVNNTHSQAGNSLRHVTKCLKTAPPKVKAAGVQMFAQAYTDFPNDVKPPAGEDAIPELKDSMAKWVIPGSLMPIAELLKDTPGGYMALIEVVGKRSPDALKKYRDAILQVDTTSFTPADLKRFNAIILEEEIPKYIAKHHGALKNESTRKGGGVTPAMEGLAAFYKKIGQDKGYDWHDYGFDRSKMKWHYHTFDPQEKREWRPGGGRYRKVTFPKGMDKWYEPGFDPLAASWKEGLSPFGQDNGKLRTERAGDSGWCAGSICNCGAPMNTFWDKEVLLIKGKFKFPPMKAGHTYRLLTAGAIHVSQTDGALIYVNGKLVINATHAPRKWKGGKPKGKLLSGDLAASFSGKEVDISAICFMRINKRSLKKGNFLNIFVQEMKNPPFTEAQAAKGKKLLAQP